VDFDGLKDQFLGRTNTPRTHARAQHAAVAAASQHNILYAKGATYDTRSDVRAYWMRSLDRISLKYTETVSTSEYEADIGELRELMNDRFHNSFCAGDHPRYQYDAGFRLSHAQKSLSVYLRHLWCLREIQTPPSALSMLASSARQVSPIRRRVGHS
jgi:hypothetical protein